MEPCDSLHCTNLQTVFFNWNDHASWHQSAVFSPRPRKILRKKRMDGGLTSRSSLTGFLGASVVSLMRASWVSKSSPFCLCLASRSDQLSNLKRNLVLGPTSLFLFVWLKIEEFNCMIIRFARPENCLCQCIASFEESFVSILKSNWV